MASKTVDVAERREFPRIAFKASALVIEPICGEVVVAHTTELSRFGCFVQTKKPLRRRSRIHVEIADDDDIFTASGVVAYVTGAGMGIAFGLVEFKNYEILAKWLSGMPRRSARYSFNATAEVRDLESPNEQVAITGDLSAHGCFINTVAPLSTGTRIRLRIEHGGAEFIAVGRVTDNVSAIGMGIEFVEVESKDRSILYKWLPEKR
jgi:PilZ domain